ncbi:MAG: hypothetical protein QM713_04725 [Arachnia sp.]
MRPVGAVTGAGPRLAVLLTLAVGLGWLAWPVWSSSTAPDGAARAAEVPWVLAAVSALLLLLGFALWTTAGRTLRPFAPAALLGTAATLTRAALHPGASGVEFLYAFPLLAGATMGGPAGFLTGAASALLSSLVTDTVTEHLVAQCLVWGLWGLAGTLVRPLGTVAAWLGAALLALPLGPLSGVLLNLTGWAGDPSESGTFLPGLPPWDAAVRLWQYCWETSFAYDLTRGVATFLFLLLVGLPLLRALRRSHDARPLPAEPTDAEPQGVAPRALARRATARTIQNMWHPDLGDPDD